MTYMGIYDRESQTPPEAMRTKRWRDRRLRLYSLSYCKPFYWRAGASRAKRDESNIIA